MYKKSTLLNQEVTLHISGKGINPNKQSKSPIITWEKFHHYKKNEQLYLLYTSPRQFNVLPFRVMKTKEIEEFEIYLEKYLA
jgi:hypothetical protein